MSVEGLWSSEIFGLWGWEHRGVIILMDGRAFGGGKNHHSVGRYSQSSDEISVSLAIKYHGKPQTMFGSTESEFKLEIDGRRDGEQITGDMYRPDRPDLRLPFRLTRQAELS
jgi:hypothetical protein